MQKGNDEAELDDWPEEPDRDILKHLVDSHAHPTDYKRFTDDKAEYRDKTAELSLDKLCAMSSHLGDQYPVQQLALEHPTHIIPAFGLHPWWSHHIAFETTSPDKNTHYTALFPQLATMSDAQELMSSFPEPMLFSTFAKDTLQPLLTAFPHAMLGEVGLDRSFRIPRPHIDAKTNRESEGSERTPKHFTQFKTPIEHQLRLLTEQLEIAFSLNRNVSMHSVQAQGQTVELLVSLETKSQHWPHCKSKICLHSYGGSADTVKRIYKMHKTRVYFSFSTTINARLQRLEELIQAVPDDRLLIESDFNDIRKSEMRMWEILRVVCTAKQWTATQAPRILQENWKGFSGG